MQGDDEARSTVNSLQPVVFFLFFFFLLLFLLDNNLHNLQCIFLGLIKSE